MNFPTTSKKHKRKKNLHESNEEDDQLSDQSIIKKKVKEEFHQKYNAGIQNEEEDVPKKIKNKKSKFRPGVEDNNDLLGEQFKNKIKSREDFNQNNKFETSYDEINIQSKKIKKKKTDQIPNIEENELLTEQLRNKKKSKKGFHQSDDIETEDGIETPSKKSRKSKIIKFNVEDELVNEELRNKKKTKELNVRDYTEEQDAEGDLTWTTADCLELIKRIESQLPEQDTLSFISRIKKLDWSQIQFAGYSVEDCKTKWNDINSNVRHFRVLGEILADAKVWIKNPVSKKGKHPDKPVRPLSSFMLFYMEKKNKIMKKNPNLKLIEISKLVGEKYNTLSEQKKAYYIQKARVMQEEYKKNLAQFYAKYPQFLPVASKKENKSKKPVTPFKLFLKDKLQKHPADENLNQHDLTEKYKEVWKNLSLKKKSYWIRQAKEQEEKYLEDLHELYEGGVAPSNYKSVITKEENYILDKAAGKPERPPNSAYSLFSRLMLQSKDENFVEGPKNRMREVASKWKMVPEEQKKAYAEEVQHMHENYKLEFANYLESLPEEKRAEELAKIQPKKKRRQKAPVLKTGPETTSIPNEVPFLKDEPDKPTVTAWDLYKNEFVSKNSHLPSNVAFKKAAASWKALSTKEVEKYKKKHDKIKQKYMVDLEAFLENLSEDQVRLYYKLKGNQSREDESSEDEEESVEEKSSEEENSSSSESEESEESDSGVSESVK